MVVATENNERFVATNLGAVMRKQGRRQQWLAKHAGVSEMLISYVLSGKRTLGKDEAQRAADALGVPLFLIFELRSRSEIGTPAENIDAD